MIVNVGGENQEVTEARGPRGKELAHFVDQHHKLPEEPVLKWIMSNRLGGCVLGSECFQVEEHVWAAAGHTAHYQQSQVAVCDPDTREGSPERTARLVDGIKTTVKRAHPVKGSAHLPL